MPLFEIFAGACKYTEFSQNAIEKRTIFMNDKNVPTVGICAKKCEMHPFCQTAIFDSGNCGMSFQKLKKCGAATIGTFKNDANAVVLGCFTCF